MERDDITTREWEVMLLWKDGSKDWIYLKGIKDTNLVGVLEYTVAYCIQDEPAISWWVSKVLRCRKIIISKVKSKYWSIKHKFMVQFPKTVCESLMIDNGAGNDY